MKPLYTFEQFENSKSMDKLPCECYQCEKTFLTLKKLITHELNANRGRVKFCSIKCLNDFNKRNLVELECSNCQEKIFKGQSQTKKFQNHFCSHSCSATFNNKNKKHGNRRSKLELYLEEQLKILYPNLDIHFNRKDAIGSELDIFIPELNIAFELNGIFHYEPIYGVDKLQKIQSNDNNKFQLCLEHKIDLCVIDTSSQKYVKPSTSQKFLDIIIKIINERLLTS